MNPDAVQRAADLMREADGLVVAAGAGMGVDSGLPDFRGNQGFWKAYPALGEAGLSFAAVASPRTFREDPRLAWGFYGHRLSLYRATEPHAGFALLRRWGQAMAHGYHVFTSNVDGHFERAGFDPQRVYECHGSIHQLQCLRGCTGQIWPADEFAPVVDHEACRLQNALPACPHCRAVARPNILMFGDGEWVPARAEAQQQRLKSWLRAVERPVVIELGAGTAIPSVRSFSEALGRRHGARLIRINPREPEVPSRADVSLALGALEALCLLERALFSEAQPQ